MLQGSLFSSFLISPEVLEHTESKGLSESLTEGSAQGCAENTGVSSGGSQAPLARLWTLARTWGLDLQNQDINQSTGGGWTRPEAAVTGEKGFGAVLHPGAAVCPPQSLQLGR